MNGEEREQWSLWFFGTLLAANFALCLYLADLYPALFSFTGIVATAVPRLLRKRGIIVIPWPLTAVTGAVSFLHAFGIVASLYDMVWWWDIMTHMLSSIVIAALIAMGILLVEAWYPFLRLPPRAFPALVVAAVILAGALWEVGEFIFDGLLGMHMQYSLDDTATDLSFDILGGAMVALMVPFYLPDLREQMEGSRLAQAL